MLSYLKTLPETERSKVEDILMSGKGEVNNFEQEFEQFIADGKIKNATFALHWDEISALAFAERLGGHDGHNLMLSAVKSSLPFSFLNGATSYAAYCTRLLFEHYKCGPFYKNVKKALFSLPYKGSVVNFSLDTQREMDPKDVLNGFISGATMSSVLPRMSLVDSMLEINESRNKNFCTNVDIAAETQDDFGLDLADTDVNYILRLTELFVTREAASTTDNSNTVNVYTEECKYIPDTI